MASQLAVLIIAHGSRRLEANAELASIANHLRDRLHHVIVEHAYLELAEPTIPAGGELCVQKGASQVVLLPYFLSLGRHVVDDLERFRSQFALKYPDVKFSIASPLGSHPLMVDILIDRLKDVQ